MSANTTGTRNIAIGYSAYTGSDTENDNIAIGYNAMTTNTAGGTQNVIVGNYAGDLITSGDGNVGFGYNALTATTTGNYNNAFGWSAGLAITEGANNVAVGQSAGSAITTGSNNIAIGKDSARTGSPGGNQTTGSNRIFLGDEGIDSAYIQVDWNVASDQRDKTDFTDLDVGLDFVNDLKPVTYKWDKRSKYLSNTDRDTVDLNTITHDGTHKEDWLDVGFKAQEVEALELAAGYKISDKTNLTTHLTEDGAYGLTYAKFVPILTKAIQELSTKNDSLETSNTALIARIEALENA